MIGPAGKHARVQAERFKGDRTIPLKFLAEVPPLSFTVFEFAASNVATDTEGVVVTGRSLENEHLRVTLNDAGDIASIMHKASGREALAEPAQLVFTYEKPAQWPAWNMDWTDRQKPPLGVVDGPAEIRVVEEGPLRGTIEVRREARGSIITQRISLEAGDIGRAVIVDCDVDWQSAECALRAAFPLTVSNPKATYNWGMGTIERGNNEPKKYEVPSHEWFDLTDSDGSFGVSILEDSKFGSDKPSDSEVRLTLLYTPGVRGGYLDQHSQDWGRHDIRYAIYPHDGDHRAAQSEWYGRRLNQPLRAFQVAADSTGPANRKSATTDAPRELSLASVSTPQVDIRALKLAESRDRVIVRVQELWGRPAEDVTVRFAGSILSAEEVDGQERPIGPATIADGALVFDLSPFSPRSFAVELARLDAKIPPPKCESVALTFDTDVVSTNADRANGAMDDHGRSLPAEQLPKQITSAGVTFSLGETTADGLTALACHGLEFALPQFGDTVHLLAAASAEDDVDAVFRIGGSEHPRSIQPWTGFVGQWDTRVFDRAFKPVDFECAGNVTDILPGFIRRDPIAWFATHHHDPKVGDQPYQFSYLFRYDLPRAKGATTLQLPNDARVKIFAVSTSEGAHASRVRPAAPLYDNFDQRKPVKFRFEYPPAPQPAHAGAEAVGVVAVDRGTDFAKLKIAPPSKNDFIDVATGSAARFHVFNPDNKYPPHGRAGVRDGTLPRLNDGDLAQNSDDVARCVWYDQEGRFYCDLGKATKVERINTYSWHRSERAPQYFSVWGAGNDELPNADISSGNREGWTLLGVIDSRSLGDGEKHASSIFSDNGNLGSYRYLLWIAENVGNGTFFTEVDVYAAD
ncbi:MAG: glycoside hydrolase family 38 C-terminal domain-containing protein [Phycisphaerae bacterium]